MTRNQIALMELREKHRSNRVNEIEKERSNKASERITMRGQNTKLIGDVTKATAPSFLKSVL